MAICSICGKRAYSEYCVLHKPKKPLKRTRISTKGKEYQRWQKFRQEVAIPYMDKHYGHFCRCCKRSDVPLDIDHIKSKGSHPGMKYQLSNLQYLDRICHYWKTNYPKLQCPHVMIEETIDNM